MRPFCRPSSIFRFPVVHHVRNPNGNLLPLRTLTTTTRAPPNRTRIAIVTGAARGIGRAISLRLARDGYAVSVSDLPEHTPALHSLTTEIQNISSAHTTTSTLRSYAHPADVTTLEQVESLVQKTTEVLGPLHTMVANAGIAQVKPLLELTPEDFRRMFDVNVLGVHYCFQAAARQMILQRDQKDEKEGGEEVNGKLIAAASIVALKPFPLLGHYTASKWAVRGLAQAYATELASERITANAYAPGIVDTKMWELIDQGLGEREGRAKGESLRKYSDEFIALGRTSVPEDVAGLVSFLASRDADYVTGQTYVVDGGIVYT